MLKQIIASTAMVIALAQTLPSGDHGASPLDRARTFAHAANNPYEGQPGAEKAGEKLFQRYCAACHGCDAKGMGKARPLISSAVKSAAPGELFWVLRNGSLTTGMPSFSKLPEEQRWQIITWLRRLNPVDAPSNSIGSSEQVGRKNTGAR